MKTLVIGGLGKGMSLNLLKIKSMKELKLIIIRGLPGSGKSTLSGSLKGTTGIIHSTDSYFITDGIYKFDETKLSEYHNRNLEDAIESMEKGISPIIIDNTNLIAEYAFTYVIEAKFYGYEIEVAETQNLWRFDIEELMKRNIRDIPRERLETMIKLYEPLEIFKEKLRI